ncbi:class F sortase [Streptomyces lateritius]|uniref:Class F sortase n=1 Tax=Streptomyces lateritius TaxID=67313 RepID=A0ABW6YG65_9ACTN
MTRTRTRTRTARRVGGGAAVLFGAVLLTAGALLLGGAPARRTAAGDAGVVPASAHPSGRGAVGAADASPPNRLDGPHGLRANLVPVGADRDGVLDLPDDTRTGGWWALGAPAGAAEGTTLLAGHVDTRRSGLGAFATLHELPLGSRVEVRAANGRTYRYVIAARRTYRQQALPRDLFTRTGPHRLALVTCTGSFDPVAAAYDSNLVLFATPA